MQRDRGAVGRPRSCRSRCSASRNIPRTSGSSTASSTCGARSCTATSCCAARSIASIRRRMIEQGFTEFQTPILTAVLAGGRARLSSCRRGCIPASSTRCRRRRSSSSSCSWSSGFDRYFQIAPCFRDEDARADRSPGEFYQLDFEMSFVTQDDVFAAIEPVLRGVFEEFADGKPVTPQPFPRIPYREAMLKYGTDKPDLRNPIVIADVTEHFRGSGFKVVRAASSSRRRRRSARSRRRAAAQPRSFFDRHERLGAAAKASRARLHLLARRASEAAAGPIAKHPGAGARLEPDRGRSSGLRRRRCGCSSSPARPEQPRSSPAQARTQRRRGAGPDRRRTASSSAGSSTSRCTSGTRREEDRLLPQPVLDAAGRAGGAGDARTR